MSDQPATTSSTASTGSTGGSAVPSPDSASNSAAGTIAPNVAAGQNETSAGVAAPGSASNNDFDFDSEFDAAIGAEANNLSDADFDQGVDKYFKDAQDKLTAENPNGDLSDVDQAFADLDKKTETDPNETGEAAQAEQEQIETEESVETALKTPEPKKFLSKEEALEKFPRQKKEVYDVIDEYGKEAAAYQELKTKLGGDEILPAAQQMIAGVLSDNPADIYASLYQIKGVEGVNFINENAIYFGICNAFSETPADSEQARLISATRETVNAAFEHQFGEGYTFERMQELAKLDSEGLLDTEFAKDFIAKRDAETNPEMTSLREKLAAAETKLKEIEETGQKTESAAVQKITESFTNFADTMIDEQLAPALNLPAFKANPNDSEFIVQAKELAQKVIREAAVNASRSAREFNSLRDKFATERNTADFKTKTKDAISQAVLTARPVAILLEKLITGSYKQTRNSQVLDKLNGNSQPAAEAGKLHEPTITQPGRAAKDYLTMSDEEFDAAETQAISTILRPQVKQFSAYRQKD